MASSTKLTNREIFNLVEGLRALDGSVGKDGKFDGYDLDDKVVWICAKNRTIVERAFDTFTRVATALKAKHGVTDKMVITADNAGQIAAYQEAENKLLDQENELQGLLKIRLSDLQSAGVKTPGVLSKLMPLIEDK